MAGELVKYFERVKSSKPRIFHLTGDFWLE